MFLNCVYNERSCPTGENWEMWLETVEAETPGFLYWLLNVFRVPKSLYDARWGVKYKNNASPPSVSSGSNWYVRMFLHLFWLL